MHGNFGRIYPNDKKIAAATQRNYFLYTPVYCFEKDNNYHIVFNNPTNNNLNVQIIKNITMLSMVEKKIEFISLLVYLIMHLIN